MQQTLYDFLFLGQVPGTNIDLNFWQVIALVALGLGYFWLRRSHPMWRYQFIKSMRSARADLTHFLQLNRLTFTQHLASRLFARGK